VDLSTGVGEVSMMYIIFTLKENVFQMSNQVYIISCCGYVQMYHYKSGITYF